MIPENSFHQNHDGGVVLFLEAPTHAIVILQAIFESYEGIGLVRTMDSKKGILTILSTVDTFDEVTRVLASLQETIPWRYCSDLSDGRREQYIAEL